MLTIAYYPTRERYMKGIPIKAEIKKISFEEAIKIIQNFKCYHLNSWTYEPIT